STVYNAGTSSDNAGIKLENTKNGKITNNNFSNNGRHGIYLWNDSDNNTISGNIAINNDKRGIYLQDDCNNNTISGNTASNYMTSKQDEGIYLDGSDNNTVSKNCK
ncbi:hypothetical protein LCGC14_1607390, partial [marine sediment metagenome]